MMHAKLSRATLQLIVGALMVAQIGVLFAAMPAGAISNRAPDPNEYGAAKKDIRLSLSNIPSTKNVTTIRVPVYVTAPSDATSVRANVDLNSFYQTYAGAFSKYHVSFTDGTGADICTVSSDTLVVNNFTWSPEYNLWVATVTARLMNRSCSSGASQASNAKIDFRMAIDDYSYIPAGGGPRTSVNSNGSPASAGGNSWISYSVPNTSNPNNDSYYFSTDARSRGGGYASYSLKFATPCSITSSTDGTIELYDLDNNNTDNGPKSSLNDDVSVTIRKDGDAGADLDIRRAGSMGNNGRYRVTMRFDPGGRYTLVVRNIYYWNVLQYRLPFDNIAYAVGCGGTVNGELSPVLDLQPDHTSIPNGMSFHAYFRALSTATSDVGAETEARIWYDANRDGDFNTGENVVYHYRSNAGSPDLITANNTTDVRDQDVVADSSLGGVICVSWQIIGTSATGVDVDDEPIVRCIPISQTPLVQVWGNDLRVGASYAGGPSSDNAMIRTGIIQMNTNDFRGSWTEYGVLAPGNISGMASGSGFANGNSSGEQSAWSKLTFANVADDLDVRCQESGTGCYATGAGMGALPDIAGAVDDGSFAGVPVTNSCSVGATTISSSRIIRCNGTLTITGNLQMAAGPFASPRDIPQMIIIANRINIRSNVTRIDSWLVGSGADAAIDTCSDRPAQLTLNDCDQRLTVNGPTIAKTLLLYRTGGSVSAAPNSPPAERFNLRSDAYIWSYAQAARSGSIRTDYVTELSPRY